MKINLYVFLNLILQVTESIPAAESTTTTTTARLQEAQRQAEINRTRAEVAEAEAKELKTQWIIRTHEIELTTELLGRSGWGTVTKAKFRGTEIAAKRYNRDLRSDYYQKMFTCEMTMAVRLQHPNLVQFIGASVARWKSHHSHRAYDN